MIGYVMIGTNDIARARAFYDPLLALLGATLNAWTNDTSLWYAIGADPLMLGVTKPFDSQAATAGNGTMVALAAPSRNLVRDLYAKALDLGATDEGAPGLRGTDADQFYGAYFRDPDGNKLAVFRIGPG